MSLLVDMSTKLPIAETSVFLGEMPDTPNITLAIYNTGGAQPIYKLNSQSPAYEQPTFQIKIRDTSYSAAITRMEAIKDAISGLYQQTINSTVYYNIFLTSDILSLGRDDRNRIELTINFRAQIKR